MAKADKNKTKQILSYNLIKEIGEGGMAAVYYAKNNIGDSFAIKVLNKELTNRDDLRIRFRTEATLLKKLRDIKGICKVIDFHEEGETMAIVMEFLEGEDLMKYIKTFGSATEELLKEWFLQILPAFDEVHSKQVIHRDVKPSNFFLTQTGEVKILDFGIAKITKIDDKNPDLTGSNYDLTKVNIIGSPMYMSPEQILTPNSIDYRTDIYSLGVTFHTLLAGQNPYQHNTDSDYIVRNNIVNVSLPLLDGVSEQMNKIIQKATAKNPIDRFQSTQEIIDAFDGKEVVLVIPTPILPTPVPKPLPPMADSWKQKIFQLLKPLTDYKKKQDESKTKTAILSESINEESKTRTEVSKPIKVNDGIETVITPVTNPKSDLEKDSTQEKQEVLIKPEPKRLKVKESVLVVLCLFILGGIIYYFNNRKPDSLAIPTPISKTPNEFQVNKDSALSYERKSDYSKAMLFFNKALAINPKDSLCNLELESCKEKLIASAKAVVPYKQDKVKENNEVKETLNKVEGNLGRFEENRDNAIHYESLGKYEDYKKAIQYFNEALKIKPKNSFCKTERESCKRKVDELEQKFNQYKKESLDFSAKHQCDEAKEKLKLALAIMEDTEFRKAIGNCSPPPPQPSSPQLREQDIKSVMSLSEQLIVKLERIGEPSQIADMKEYKGLFGGSPEQVERFMNTSKSNPAVSDNRKDEIRLKFPKATSVYRKSEDKWMLEKIIF